MSSYYNTNNGQVLNEIGVARSFGEQVVDWHWSRQAGVGLYRLHVDSPEYNYFDEEVVDTTYVKIDDSDERFQPIFLVGEHYVTEYIYAPIANANYLASQQKAAEKVIADYVAAQLDKTDTYVLQAVDDNVAVHPDLLAYRAALRAIDQHPDYPGQIGYEVSIHNYVNFPLFPTNFLDTGSPNPIVSSSDISCYGSSDSTTTYSVGCTITPTVAIPGEYVITFEDAQPNTNYTLMAITEGPGNFVSVYEVTTTGFKVSVVDTSGTRLPGRKINFTVLKALP